MKTARIMPDRRHFLTAACVAAMFGILPVSWLRAASSRMSVADAHAKAAAGDLLLLDIRTPEEWKRTGIGASAHPLSMQDPKFLQKLTALTGGAREKPVALICATGGRSAYLQRILARAGYPNVADVAEGMLGSRDGPGWVRSGLPLKRYSE